MSVVGICMTKDEADIIETTVRHMLTQVDDVIVSDNGSTDGTREILRTLPITLLDDPDPAYYQSEKMTRLAKVARNQGADWIVPFDSDEIWYSPFGLITNVLSEIAEQWLVATATLYDHVATAEDPQEADPVKRIGWRRRESGPLPKVACRWRDDLVIEQGNHGAWYEGGPTHQNGLLVIRHYPYRSVDQFVSKVRNGSAAYKHTTLPESAGAHWRQYGDILDRFGVEGIEDIYYTWFHSENPKENETLIYDPAPVQS